MTLGDAILAREADRHGARAIVTWNVRDFHGRIATPAIAPDRFLAEECLTTTSCVQNTLSAPRRVALCSAGVGQG
jgi:hypothetical protein